MFEVDVIVIAGLVALGALFSYFGWSWESKLQRPKALKKWPKVSVLIPAYKSKNLSESIASAAALDYPEKEIIVVNDSVEDFEEAKSLCSQYGARLVQRTTRLGKAESLNRAVVSAKGSILYFLDSDTTTEPDTLKKIVPWFSNPRIGAVSPKYVAKNKASVWSRLIAMEHFFVSSMFKIQMHFGSLVSFRGCAVAIRKDLFQKLGGWPHTMIEDTDLSALILKSGSIIQYEPAAVVKTYEPESLSALRSQRVRWGKGTLYSFPHHKGMYAKNIQFNLYFVPYILMFLAVLAFGLYQTTTYFLPFMSLYLIYTISVRELLTVFMLFALPVLYSSVASLATGGIVHMAILTAPEKPRAKDSLLVIPYIFVFFPLVMAFYIKGMLSAARAKRRGLPEVDFSDW